MAIEKPFISIVVPTYNCVELARRCISSIINIDYPINQYEVIIIDDASSDGTFDVLRKEFKDESRVLFVRNRINLGTAASRNLGFRKAKGTIIVTGDSDCCMPANWLKSFLETFERFPQAAVVGGSLVNPTDSPVAWASYLLEFSMWLPLGRARLIRDLPSCNIAYKKEAIRGFEFIEAHKGIAYEESIFHYQLRQAGHCLVFNPGIQVQHYKWENNFTIDDYLRSQVRYGKGFIQGGYKVHGIIGKILISAGVLNLLCPRILIVFFRCLKNRKFFWEFIKNSRLIFQGELLRNRLVSEEGLKQKRN